MLQTVILVRRLLSIALNALFKSAPDFDINDRLPHVSLSLVGTTGALGRHASSYYT